MITEILMTALTAMLTALIPVLVALAFAAGKRALAAFETSKFAEAYAKLDPTVRSAVNAAADAALLRVIDSRDQFDRDDVEQQITSHAWEALNALELATGVRTGLQVDHVRDLIKTATEEVLTSVDEIMDGEGLGAYDHGDESGVPYLKP
jgi:hypothetical protein